MPISPESTLEECGWNRGIRPCLAVIDMQGRGDGIAYAARLLYAGLCALNGRIPALLAVNPRTPRSVTAVERARYSLHLLAAQLGPGDFWIFSHLGIARPMAAIPRRIRKPYAVMLNGIEAWDPTLDGSRLQCLRDANVRIAISHHTQRRVAITHPTIGNILACPLALLPDEHRFAETADIPAEGGGANTVIIVGRMSADERYKGHDQLLECWPLVIRDQPDARLLMVGGGDDRERLQAKAAGLGIGDSVHFTGYLPDDELEGVLRRSGVFAMPSRGEGFGLVYLAAMRAGLPCIGSRADAAGDIIVNGETGFLVDQADTDSLADAIVRLLTNPKMRRRMGAAGRARFEREFTFERYVARLGPILTEAFGCRSR